MSNKNSVIALFDRHTQAQDAVEQLQRAGFDMKKLLIVGKAYRTEEKIVGYYTTGDRMKYWGTKGALWGGIWGLLAGSGFPLCFGHRSVGRSRALVAPIVAALHGAVVVGGLSALGAGLYSMGIPKKSILQYETAIKAGTYMLVVHGTADEVTRAKAILSTSEASDTQLQLTDAPGATLA